MKQAFAGIDLGGTNLKYGICDSNGSVIQMKTVPANAEAGPAELLERIGECGRDLLEIARTKSVEIEHVGLGTPGTVDLVTGEISGMAPNIRGWKGRRPGVYLEAEIGLPVFVENDANAMILAEHLFGAAKGCRSVVGVTVGTGIGGGIIVDGKLVRGADGAAAEIGHASIILDGEECACGRLGCLEAYAATNYLIKMAEGAAREPGEVSRLSETLSRDGSLTVEMIFEAFAGNSDPVAESIVKRSANYLAAGLASLVTILNPEIVIIGGGIADAGGSRYIELVRSGIMERAIEPAVRNLRVEKAVLGNKAGFIGAAFLGEHQ